MSSCFAGFQAQTFAQGVGKHACKATTLNFFSRSHEHISTAIKWTVWRLAQLLCLQTRRELHMHSRTHLRQPVPELADWHQQPGQRQHVSQWHQRGEALQHRQAALVGRGACAGGGMYFVASSCAVTSRAPTKEKSAAAAPAFNQLVWMPVRYYTTGVSNKGSIISPRTSQSPMRSDTLAMPNSAARGSASSALSSEVRTW